MQYLSEMTEEQTLVMCSGHPQGLFPSSPSAPRAVITNGMVRQRNIIYLILITILLLIKINFSIDCSCSVVLWWW